MLIKKLVYLQHESISYYINHYKLIIMQKFYTTQDFIEKARKVHGNKYDYSKVDYENASTKVCIICPEHGEFWQLPVMHLAGSGCPFCSRKAKFTTQEFIEKAREIHGDKYDYSKVVYQNSVKPVCIICPEHGEFWQSPNSHLTGHGCPACYGNKKLTTAEFIKRAHEIHGDRFDYSRVVYKNIRTHVRIICPVHGEIWQNPLSHLHGCGCDQCARTSKYTTEDFIEAARKVHGDRYDYSKVVYKNNSTKVCIICPEHGEFWQRPFSHLKGTGCPECNGIKKYTLEEFIEKARKVHGDKYDYSKVEYINSITKICIICPEHGEFWQLPYKHLSGQNCPVCARMKSPANEELNEAV